MCPICKDNAKVVVPIESGIDPQCTYIDVKDCECFEDFGAENLISKIQAWGKQSNEFNEEQILVPTFEIAACPTIKLSEIKERRFHIVDKYVL